MQLRELEYLVALADEGSFTRAAARCWVSQQALSRAVAALERRLGVLLVVRRPRGCSLTPAGSRLVSAARALLRDAAALDALGRGLGVGKDDGVLRVGALLDGLGARTPPLVAAFRAAWPDLHLRVQRVQPSDLPGVLLSGEVDVVLLHGPCEDPRVTVVPLFDERRAVVVSAGDPRADAPALSVRDLVDLPARARRPGVDPAWEGVFTLRAERGGEEPERIGDPAGSLEELLWAISVDRLFLTVPEHLATSYPGTAYGVSYVPVPDAAPVVFAVAHRRGDRRAHVQGFVQLARTVAGGRSPEARLSAHNQEVLDAAPRPASG